MRPIQLDDFLATETIGMVTFSPAGQSLAFTRRRPMRDLASSAVIDQTLDDVWLQEKASAPARNLTQGAADRSGAWAPQWSPQGGRLAYLSSRGGKVALWAWDRASERTRPLSTHSVQLVDTGPSYQWVDEHRVLFSVAPESESSLPLSSAGQTVQQAGAVWARAARGEPTASAVDSLKFMYPTRELVLLDVDTGTVETIATTLLPRGRPMWWAAPGGHAVAVVRPKPSAYAFPALSRLGHPRDLELHSLGPRPLHLQKPLPENVLTDTIQWSPDGREVAFFAHAKTPINPLVLFGAAAAEVMPDRVESLDNPARLWRVNIDQGTVEPVETGEIDRGFLGAPAFVWTASGELLFRAPRIAAGVPTFNNIPRVGNGGPTAPWRDRPLGPAPILHWWVLGRDGRTRPLTRDAGHVPNVLEALQGGSAFVGVADGDLWVIDPVTGGKRNVTTAFGPVITYLQPAPSGGYGARVTISAGPPKERTDRTAVNLGLREYTALEGGDYIFDTRSGEAMRLTRPASHTRLLQVDTGSATAVYLVDDNTGTVLWRVPATGPSSQLAEINTFRRMVLTGERKVIDFTSNNNDRLNALVVLPPGFTTSRRYPTVFDVYLATDLSGQRLNQIDPPSATEQIVSAAGYIYVKPSIPMNLPGLARGEEGESIFMLGSTVLPLLDRLINMGLADSDRAFVMGHSKGGWSAAGLLTQTTRFKAGLANAGSYNGELVVGAAGGSIPHDSTLRYTDIPHDMAMPNVYWKGMYPTDVPFWRDGDRLRRNSVFSYVDRIQTPLLIIHGDLDQGASFDQAEDLFRALVAQRKRAQFVRYWGEGHVFKTPANIRDRWQRTFAWFDDFGDISRDAEGQMIFEGDRVRSRHGEPALTPDAFARFGPLGSTGNARLPQTSSERTTSAPKPER